MLNYFQQDFSLTSCPIIHSLQEKYAGFFSQLDKVVCKPITVSHKCYHQFILAEAPAALITDFRFSAFRLLTPCRVLSSHACLCGIKLLVVFVILLIPTFYCIPSVPFYCVFLFHYFIVNSICKPYSSQGTINIELNCTQSFQGRLEGGGLLPDNWKHEWMSENIGGESQRIRQSSVHGFKP